MRWKRKLLLTILAAAASAVGGTELAKKRFGEGRGEAYRKFLDQIIRYRDKTMTGITDESSVPEERSQNKDII